MRHRLKGKKLGRNTKQRKALFKSLITALIINGEIITTQAKAKAVKHLVDKLVSRAKRSELNSRRIIHAFFNKKSVTNKLVDELAPKMNARTSGYTKITRLGARRGDNSMMVKLEFTDKISQKTAKKDSQKTKSTPAKSKSKTSTIQKAIKRLSAKPPINQTNVKLTTQRTTSK